MPNRFTRVPDRPVPPLPWLGRMVLPLADLFMILMASRPRSGSLRTTWVTPATIRPKRLRLLQWCQGEAQFALRRVKPGHNRTARPGKP